MKTKGFLGYVIPNILGMLGLSCYILADTFFVSKAFGSDGLAALNYSISIYSFISGLGLMLGIGGASWYAILIARKKHEKGNKVFTHTCVIGLALGFIFVLIGLLFSSKLAVMLGANSDVLDMTNIYLKTILCFAPFFIMNNILLAFVRNDGNPRLSMTGMLIGSIANIVLDYVFMFIFNMGMFGAAFATGLAPIISMLILSIHFIRKKNNFKIIKSFIPFESLRSICSLGFSAFVIEFSSGIVLIIFNLIIKGLSGNVGVAAYGVIANISLVVIAIFTGIGQGIQPLASKAFGENNISGQKIILRKGIIMSFVLAVLSYLTLVIFSKNIIQIFNSENNEQLIQIANTGFYIYFIGFLFACINIVSSAFLSAIQKPKSAFLISTVRGIAVIPLAFLFSILFKINGVWLSFAVAELISLILSIISLKNKKIAIDSNATS